AYRIASGENWLALLGPDKDYTPIEPWGRKRSRSETARVDKEWDKITGENYRNPFYNLYMWELKDKGIWLFDDRGTLHAVNQFLESLGVRWYMPGELGTVIPEQKSISVQTGLNKAVKPEFNLRSFTWWSQPNAVLDIDADWRLKLGIHHQYDTLGIPQVCHGTKFVHGRDEFRKANPEVFALINGKRDTEHKRHGAPCLSSELLFKKHLKYVRAMFEHYKEPVVSIDLVDGYSGRACQCPDCVKQKSPERGAAGELSDFVFNYINKVAKEIYKSHPDKKVSAFSYGSYCLPPTNIKKMSPNLIVVLMSSRQTFNLDQHKKYFTNLTKDWKKVLPSGELYTFENIAYNYKKKNPVLPVYFTKRSKKFFDAVGKEFKGHYYSIYEHRPWLRDKQEWDALATAHLDIYILSKMLWKSDIDVDALVAEYCSLFYGPAAEEMKAFIDYCEANHQKMRSSVADIDQALKLIAKAKDAALPDTIYGKRVAMVADYVEQLNDLRTILAKPRTGPKVELTRAAAKDIQFDGKLDDSFWKNIPAAQLKDLKTGKLPEVGTTVKLAWADNDSLYIGVHCEEPDMSGLTDTADGTMSVFNGDNIDIHIETPIVDFYQLAFGPSGNLYDMDRSGVGRMRFNTKWNSGVSIKTYKGKNFWSAEIQIPAAGAVARDLDPNHQVAGDLPTSDAPWYFNIGRQRPRKGNTVFAAYVPAYKSRFDDRFLRATLIVK
ncbi:MAG: DUF4838 domain-containing protein, partial [Planctomycetota bacterium]